MRGGRRASWMAVGVGVVGVLVAPSALAAPATTPVPFHETFPGFTGACDFPVTVTFDTDQTERLWSDASGQSIRLHVTGRGTVTVTNDVTGASVTATASGPTLARKGTAKGTGSWVLIGPERYAEFLPYPPGVWAYTGKIADVDAADYGSTFRGHITDLCAAID